MNRPRHRGEAVADATAFPHDGGIRIRRAEMTDLLAVIDLDARVTGVAKETYWRDLFRRYLDPQRDQRFALVAVSEGPPQPGALVGFIIGEVRAWEFGSSPCGWVFAVSIDPDERLRGAGTALFEAISDRFRAVGVSTIRTMLSRRNHLLMSFFRSHGMMAGPYIQLEKRLDGAEVGEGAPP